MIEFVIIFIATWVWRAVASWRDGAIVKYRVNWLNFHIAAWLTRDIPIAFITWFGSDCFATDWRLLILAIQAAGQFVLHKIFYQLGENL